MTTTPLYSDGVQGYISKGEVLKTSSDAEYARMRRMKFDTIAVHGVYGLEAALSNQGSLNEPLYLSPAQTFESSDHLETALAYLMPAWTYSRYANPTVGYLEETLALLESYGFDGEVNACATGSGMAAIFLSTNPFLVNTAQETSNRSDRGRQPNIVASAKIYGGTFMLFQQRYGAERGVEVRWVYDPLDLDEWASHIDENTRFVYGEMPSNPSLAVFDIAGLAEIAHRFDIPLIVDSTVATPALLRPLLHGADIVVHSVSKNMATSGLAIAGVLVARRGIPSQVGPNELRQDFARYIKQLPYRDYGPSLSPFNALMVLNDLRTLRMRMDAQSRGAMQVARFLVQHPNVEAVWYPGLEGIAGHEISRRYLWLADSSEDYGEPVNRYGALLGFTVKGGMPAARRVFDQLKLIWRAADLGRIKSLATIPAISTHQQQGAAGRQLAGLPEHLIRLSVGGEATADLIDDLDQALVVTAG